MLTKVISGENHPRVETGEHLNEHPDNLFVYGGLGINGLIFETVYLLLRQCQ